MKPSTRNSHRETRARNLARASVVSALLFCPVTVPVTVALGAPVAFEFTDGRDPVDHRLEIADRAAPARSQRAPSKPAPPKSTPPKSTPPKPAPPNTTPPRTPPRDREHHHHHYYYNDPYLLPSNPPPCNGIWFGSGCAKVS